MPAATRPLSRRERIPEKMDDPALDPADHTRALRALSRINRLSLTARTLWPPITDLARQRPGHPIRLLDVATGAGDVPLCLWRRAQRTGIPLHIHACDVSPVALDHAQSACRQHAADITFFQCDALRAADIQERGQYDVATCSLFLHHLDEDNAVALLQTLGHVAKRLILVNDLLRNNRSLLLAHVAARVLTRSPVVRFDGPASVRAAFTLPEVATLARRAGLRHVHLEKHWPCRFLLRTTPPSSHRR